MGIKQVTTNITGLTGIEPHIIYVTTDDSLDTVTTAGYLNSARALGYTFDASDLAALTYVEGGVDVSQFFRLSFSGTTITLIPLNSDVTLPTVSDDLVSFSDADGGIEDSGIAKSTVILNSVAAGQTIVGTTSSATPGTIRALRGQMTGSATVMTSGNLVGVRGEVDCVGASGGFLYGAQGKVIPTGTLSGSVWVAGIFGQFDVSAATINAGQCAAIWGDWGTTGATATDLTGCRGFAFTNTTANVLNAQDYRYGNATYLLELAGAGGTLNYYASAGTASGSAGNSTHCAAQQVIKVEINGSAAYIPVFTQNT